MNKSFEIPSQYTVRKIDYSVANITYIGYSNINNNDDENWILQKIDETTEITNITYGEGSWNNRYSLTYK